MLYGAVLLETMVSNMKVSVAAVNILDRAYDADPSFAGSGMAFELEDTHIESGIDPDVPPQAFAASIDGENGIHALPADPSVGGPSQTSDVQPDGQAGVITPLGPEAYTNSLQSDRPTASEGRDVQLASSPSLSGARPVSSGVQSFDSTVAM